jgi:PTS system mannose-specific IIA component
MIGVLIVTHGGLAGELLSAAEMITGGLNGFEALSLRWTEGFEEARAQIAGAIERLNRGAGVVVLTDMFGDTPTNAALSLSRPGFAEVITGVNLPMVVRLGCLATQEMELTDLARWLQAKGRRAIRHPQEAGPRSAKDTVPDPGTRR